MNALTYDLRNAAATARTARASKAGKGFWARVFDAIVEARMRQAEREIALHRHLIPTDALKSAGYERTLYGSKDLPFVK